MNGCCSSVAAALGLDILNDRTGDLVITRQGFEVGALRLILSKR